MFFDRDNEETEQVRKAFAERLDDIVTDPRFGQCFAGYEKIGELVRSGGMALSNVQMFKDALAATCDDLRIPHERRKQIWDALLL